jgi:hypothetical protein
MARKKGSNGKMEAVNLDLVRPRPASRRTAALLPEVNVVKTSVALPRHLWKAAHNRAMDEGCDLKDVIAAALETYLKTKRESR